MYLPTFRLDGKTAIVTGAGRGIGRAIAVGLAEAGADVAIMSRTESDLRETARLIEAAGRKACMLAMDVTERDQVQKAVSVVIDEFKEINILVNNAGMNIRSKALEVTDEEWQKIMDTNLKSAFMMSQEIGRTMADNKNGASILSISSVGGHTALRTGVVYAATKAAMIQMTKVLALEWGTFGIRVNSLGPWYFKTPLTEKLLSDEQYVNDILAVTPLNRIGELYEIVGPAVFLASDASSYITGQTLFVDGGMTIKGF